MRARTTLTLVAAATALTGVLAPAAQAADTSVTFTVTSGGLSLNAPASVALSGGGSTLSLAAGSISGTMGTVTVTDARGGLGVSGWTVSVSGTDFTTTDNGGGTIAKSAATVSPGVPVPVSGVPVLVPAVAPVSLTGGTLLTATSALGSNSATYTPTVSVTVPSTAKPGAYTGTVTQTVA